VFLLGLNVIYTFTILFIFCFLFVYFIFNKHLFKIFTFLITLMCLKLAFSLHFFLKTINEFNFLFKCIFFIVSTFFLFFNKLAITRFFLLLSLDTAKFFFFLFSHAKKFYMLLLKLLINFVFFPVLFFTLRLFLHLLIQFLAHQAASLLLPQNRLLLFLVMKKLIEFLNRCPFILFSYFTVDFS